MSNVAYSNLEPKVVAILRGITPEEVESHCGALIEAGIRAIEIPLNSPVPYRSIELAVRLAPEELGNSLLIGAGTVLATHQVKRLYNLGANLIVSPNADHDVIKSTRSHEMVSIPGIMTPTEAFQAIDAGATALKLFPANIVGQTGLAAMKAVLPKDFDVLVVGGVDADNFAAFRTAGAIGLGVGTSIYRPGQSVLETRKKARAIIAAAAS